MNKGLKLKKSEIQEAFADEEARRRFPVTMTVQQVSDMLGRSPKTVYEWMSKGRLDGAYRRRPFFATLAFAGLRVGEAVHLRPRDIDLKGGWIRVLSRDESRTKTGLSRKVPIHPRLRTVLRKVAPQKSAPYFFTSPSTKAGLAINPRDPNQWLKRLARELDLPLGRKNQGMVVHSFRHFFRTHCTNAGVPTYIIDEWMGHVGERTTGKIYFQLTEQMSQNWMQRVGFGSALRHGNSKRR